MIEPSLLNLSAQERATLAAFRTGQTIRGSARVAGVPYSTFRERVLRLVAAGFLSQVRTGTASVYAAVDDLDCATSGRCPMCNRPLPTRRPHGQ